MKLPITKFDKGSGTLNKVSSGDAMKNLKLFVSKDFSESKLAVLVYLRNIYMFVAAAKLKIAP